ncbi:hypothetical protein ACET3Z_030834 [Daucus carota]
MGFQVFVHLFWPILLFAISGVLAERAEVAGEKCKTSRCSHHGPEIRFPFQLRDRQPEHCGLPGFRVSCHKGKTILELQYTANTTLPGIQLSLSKEVVIMLIDYTSQTIFLSESLSQNANLTLVSTPTSSHRAISPPPFDLSPRLIPSTFASCSSRAEGHQLHLTSLNGQAFPVYYFTEMVNRPDYTTSCTKLFNSYFPTFLLDDQSSFLTWSTPNCEKCEAKGEYCKLMKNSTSSNIQTVDYSTTCLSKRRRRSSVQPIAVIIPGARNNNAVENTTDTYFPEWIYHHLEEGGEVAIQIENEEDSNIAKKLTIVGLWCIGWHPADRPSMKHVIHMLESQECPTMPPNPFGTPSIRSFRTDLEVISESNDQKLLTEDLHSCLTCQTNKL